MQNQQQIVAHLDTRLKQAYQQLQSLLEQAGGGLQGMIASRPDDFIAFNNALAAIGHQATDLADGMQTLWEDEIREQLSDLEDEQEISIDAAEHHCEKLVRDGTQWLNDQWARFAAQWRMQAVHGMWPLVEEALKQPASCTNCGGPLQTQQRRVSESATCPSCRVVNQTTPPPVVGMYYSMAPDIYAANTVVALREQVAQQRNAWEDERVAIKQRTGDWPDHEPIESLRQWEQLERAYWTQFAQAKAQMEPHDEAALVDSRMKSFHDAMAHEPAWRAAHGMGLAQADLQAQLSNLPDNVVDWGPLQPNQVEENFYHQMLLQMVETDQALHQQLLTKLGYRDAVQRAFVDRTFLRHYQERAGEDWFQAAVNAGAMRAMQERGALMAETNQHLLEPIEGVSLEVYASITAQVGNLSQQDFTRLLAQHQLDAAKYERINKQWMDRMSKDTTGTIATAYSKAFMGQGQYGAAGQAAAANLGAGGMPTAAGAEGAEPVPFEKYAEISGAMAAWSKQGKDISAMLDQHFQMNATDFSNISMWWSTKMTTEMSLFEKMAELTEHYEQVWLTR